MDLAYIVIYMIVCRWYPTLLFVSFIKMIHLLIGLVINQSVNQSISQSIHFQ